MINNTESKVIDFLRFVLTVMVVFIHVNRTTIPLSEIDAPLFTYSYLSNIVKVVISNVLCRIAVPLFFTFSGYLFFINIKTFDKKTYISKIKSRILTLLLPYLVWNTTTYLLSNTHYDISSWLHSFWDFWGGSTTFNILHNEIRIARPIDYPMWFIRDLFIMELLSPIFYYFLKKTKIYGLVILLIAFVSRIWFKCNGLSIDAVFFFGLGSYITIYDYTLVGTAKKLLPYAIPIAIVSVPLAIYYDGLTTYMGQNVLPFAILSLMCLVIYGTCYLTERNKLSPNRFLVGSCFFIFALHEASIFRNSSRSLLGLVNQKLGDLFTRTAHTDFLLYLLSPIVTIGICIALYYILSKVCPKVVKICLGIPTHNRTNS